jgi:hypothetical protein
MKIAAPLNTQNIKDKCLSGVVLIGGPELKFSSSVTFFPIFGLTAVLKILSIPALALGDNIADL